MRQDPSSTRGGGSQSQCDDKDAQGSGPPGIHSSFLLEPLQRVFLLVGLPRLTSPTDLLDGGESVLEQCRVEISTYSRPSPGGGSGPSQVHAAAVASQPVENGSKADFIRKATVHSRGSPWHVRSQSDLHLSRMLIPGERKLKALGDHRAANQRMSAYLDAFRLRTAVLRYFVAAGEGSSCGDTSRHRIRSRDDMSCPACLSRATKCWNKVCWELDGTTLSFSFCWEG